MSKLYYVRENKDQIMSIMFLDNLKKNNNLKLIHLTLFINNFDL